jgi:hypothetical protein
MLFGGLLHRLIQRLDLAVQLLEQLQQIFPPRRRPSIRKKALSRAKIS